MIIESSHELVIDWDDLAGDLTAGGLSPVPLGRHDLADGALGTGASLHAGRRGGARGGEHTRVAYGAALVFGLRLRGLATGLPAEELVNALMLLARGAQHS